MRHGPANVHESDLFRAKPPRIYKLKRSPLADMGLATKTRGIDRVNAKVKNRHVEMIHLR